MTHAILMLYGNHALHPWQEDMFFRPDLLQRDLRAASLEFHIACVVHKPTGRDELPQVRIARDPVYNLEGVLVEATFGPGSIVDYPVIIDHWVSNFQQEITHPDGTIERVAHGIGLPARRLLNHKSVQYFGNRKDKMHTILEHCGVAIDTWNVWDIDKLADRYGDHPVIYKPLGGSRSKGIRTFDLPADVWVALEAGSLGANGLIQPFFDTTQPLQDLMPLTRYHSGQLLAANARADRAREVRMHVMVTTDSRGQRSAKAYPLVKTSAPGTNRLPFHEIVPIHPDSFPPGSYIYEKSVKAALELAGASNVPYLYGAVDWIRVKPSGRDEEQWLVVDFNCRGPGLPYEAIPVRQGFVELLAGMATQEFQQIAV